MELRQLALSLKRLLVSGILANIAIATALPGASSPARTLAVAENAKPGLGCVVTQTGDKLQVRWEAGTNPQEHPLLVSLVQPPGASLDLGRSFAMTELRITLEGEGKDDLVAGYYDVLGQTGSGVPFDQADYHAETKTWTVPMAKATGLRLDQVAGVWIAPKRQPKSATATLTLSLPVVIRHTGRRDNRPANVAPLPEAVSVQVDAGHVLKDLTNFGYGCHWDYAEGGEADDMKVPITFYRDMGFNNVRMTGTRSDPADAQAQAAEYATRAWPKLKPLAFTRYVELLRQAGIPQVTIIQPYNEYFLEGFVERMSLKEWFGQGFLGARHLREQPGLRVRWHELGNEVWARDATRGGQSGVPFARVARDVEFYSSQIKAQDPDARFTVSLAGMGSPNLLAQYLNALPSIDAINQSWYLWQDSYEKFRNRLEVPGLKLKEIRAKIAERDPAAARRIVFGATEYASHDWSGEWHNVADLGHALCTFQKAAEGTSDPELAFVIYWTVRWYWERADPATGNKVWRPYNDYPTCAFSLVRQDGSRTAIGEALRLFGRNRLDRVLHSSSSQSPQVLSFAFASHDGKKLNLFLLNKDYGAKTANIELRGFVPSKTTSTVFTGEGINDPAPSVGAGVSPIIEDGRARVVLPETSITLLAFERI